MTKPRVLVCGGRDYVDAARVWSVLDYYRSEGGGFAVVIHGAARGADSLAGSWAEKNGIPQQAYPADWNTWGRVAGPRRNGQMLIEGKPDFVIAFPGGRGTANMINQAQAVGVPVLLVPA